MRSNCIAFALRECRRRYALWSRAGMPRKVIHWRVGGWTDPALEFAPLERRDVPWWLAWTRLVFRGRVRPADFAHTLPSMPSELSER